MVNNKLKKIKNQFNSMETSKTKFEIWWNKPVVKRWYGVLYSVGASIVIIGALFKIRHLPFANEVLTFGMLTEAFLFAMSAFDKPYKEFDWSNVFDFENNNINKLNTQIQSTSPQSSRNIVPNYSESISDEDIKKLSQGIKSLSATAQQLTAITSAADVTESFVTNIETATAATKKFTRTQETLVSAVEQLQSSYLGVSTGMEAVEKNTKSYAIKVDDINKNLSSINSIYEIQLKNIHVQSEALTIQSESLRKVSDELNSVSNEVKKIKAATLTVVEDTENFRAATSQLSRQVADLNKVYGNMLNALS